MSEERKFAVVLVAKQSRYQHCSVLINGEQVIPSVKDVEPLEILDVVTCILKSVFPTEVRKTTETTDVNLTKHEHSLGAG